MRSVESTLTHPHQLLRLSFRVAAFALAPIVACGGGSSGEVPASATPYTSKSDETVVVGDGKGGAVYATPAGAGCLQIGAECVKPQDKCGAAARADVIVDSAGKVVEIVCYPPASNPPNVEATGTVDLDKENKGVIALDGVDDGLDIAGDVSSKGNNVTVYGQGTKVSVIGGSVAASGNNFSLRGVTVKGNVTIKGNNATLVLCAIDGNLTIEGNNAVVAECVVSGRVTITGNNSKLLSNKVQGPLQVNGTSTTCDANVSFAGAALSCGDTKK